MIDSRKLDILYKNRSVYIDDKNINLVFDSIYDVLINKNQHSLV